MYIGKTKPWPANLSRRRKKERTEKGADDEETTAPLPWFLMNQRKKDKKKKRRNRFLKRQEQQKASVHCSLKLKTNVQSKDKTGFQNVNTTDLKAAKEEKVKTYTCRSQRFFCRRWNGKPGERCCQGLAANLPVRLVFFLSSFLTITPECKKETPSIYCVFFYSAYLAIFVSLRCVFFLPLTLRVSLLFPALSFCVFHPLS